VSLSEQCVFTESDVQAGDIAFPDGFDPRVPALPVFGRVRVFGLAF